MLALAPYIGRGTRLNMFRPVGLGDPGAHAIDLRADGGATKDGAGQPYALLSHPDIRDPRLIQLGEHPDEPLARATRKKMASVLHVQTRGRFLRDLVSSIMLRPPVNGWNPIGPIARPHETVRYEIHLGPEPLVLDTGRMLQPRRHGALGTFCAWACHIWLGSRGWVPAIAGGLSASDNFNRANETPIGGNWTQGLQPTNLVSNALVAATASDSFVTYNAVSFTADQDVTLDWATGATGDGGPAARATAGAGALNGYFLTFGSNPPICKYVAGSFTAVGGTTTTPSLTNTYRLTAVGTTLSAFLAGVAKGSTTDSAITAAGATGAFVLSGNTWDNWTAADVGGVTNLDHAELRGSERGMMVGMR